MKAWKYKRENWADNIYEEILATNYGNKSHQSTGLRNSKDSSIFKDEPREERENTCGETKIGVRADVSSKTKKAKLSFSDVGKSE